MCSKHPEKKKANKATPISSTPWKKPIECTEPLQEHSLVITPKIRVIWFLLSASERRRRAAGDRVGLLQSWQIECGIVKMTGYPGSSWSQPPPNSTYATRKIPRIWALKARASGGQEASGAEPESPFCTSDTQRPCHENLPGDLCHSPEERWMPEWHLRKHLSPPPLLPQCRDTLGVMLVGRKPFTSRQDKTQTLKVTEACMQVWWESHLCDKCTNGPALRKGSSADLPPQPCLADSSPSSHWGWGGTCLLFVHAKKQPWNRRKHQSMQKHNTKCQGACKVSPVFWTC